MRTDYKLIAFDLDGTLTQHRTKLGEENRAVLDKLARKYKLLMMGAGACTRIFGQMNEYPIDIVGNYGMQIAKYNHETKQLDVIETAYVEPDRERTEKVKKASLHPCLDLIWQGAPACIQYKVLELVSSCKFHFIHHPCRFKACDE